MLPWFRVLALLVAHSCLKLLSKARYSTRAVGKTRLRQHAMRWAMLLIPLASGLRPTQQHVRRETALSSTTADGGGRLEPRVPTDSDDMVIAAARSVRTALEAGVARQTVELHIPLPPETSPEDLDP